MPVSRATRLHRVDFRTPRLSYRSGEPAAVGALGNTAVESRLRRRAVVRHRVCRGVPVPRPCTRRTVWLAASGVPGLRAGGMRNLLRILLGAKWTNAADEDLAHSAGH